MARLYRIFYLALLVLVVSVESAAQTGELARLSEVAILIETLSRDAKELGLNRDDIKNHVFVLMRSKLPRLIVNESADPYVYIRATLHIGKSKSGTKLNFYGAIQLHVKRRVSISKTGKSMFSDVWESIYIITGQMSDTNAQTRHFLDLLVTKFAAEWYRDNP